MAYNALVKRYGQYCPVAHALDQVGDRWELLVVRELMLGQRRYTDLAEALPGIGSNILASRLRDLESAGIVRKTKLPPPWAVTVYELTEHGRALEPVLRSLAGWGARTLGAPDPGDCWSMYAVHVRFRPDAAVDGIYEIRFVDGETISMEVSDGTLVARKLSADEPDLVVEAHPEALHALVQGAVTMPAALADGGVRILTGSEQELAVLVAMFAPAEADPAVDGHVAVEAVEAA
jgi:DNA-binding HxlR family transcriptional regulator